MTPVRYECDSKYITGAFPWPRISMGKMNEEIFSNPYPYTSLYDTKTSLRWRHNGRDSASNHQPHDCLLNRLFRRRSKKTSKLRVTALCAGNSPGIGEFPAQMASNAENVSIWCRHHVKGGIFKKNEVLYEPTKWIKYLLCLGLWQATWLPKLICSGYRCTNILGYQQKFRS